jgi:hypothetical protein
MPDEMTPGEIGRRFERIERDQRATDDRITGLARDMVPNALWAAEHKALEERLTELRSDMTTGFDRIERTSQERKAALERKDTELGREIAAIRKAAAEERSARERARPGTLTNWLTGIGVFVALIALIVTIVTTTHGGH